MPLIKLSLIVFSLGLFVGCQRQQDINQRDIQQASHDQTLQDDLESDLLTEQSSGCLQATSVQRSYVDSGAVKLKQFLERCYQETSSKKWCDQVARPNPDSANIFECTYSPSQRHVLIHPSESTWSYAIGAVKLVQELEKKNIKIELIYNWWRPEPYNKNVGGAAGRHPFGTSVDVRFVGKSEQNKAHAELCAFRKQGKLRALGYYSGTGLHLGVGDQVANTWGRPCPN